MKGVSPLLSGILLVAITVTVASLASGWFTSTIRASTDTATNRTDAGLLCSGASISIDNLFITGTSSATVTASVRNTGQTDTLALQNAQIFNSTGSNFSATNINTSTKLNKGEVFTLSFVTASFDSCPGSFSELLITTNCGGITDKYTGTPKCN